MIFKSPTERELVQQWHRDGLIQTSDLQKAIAATDSLPSSRQWEQFITHLLLWLGLVSLGAGIIFFLAFNWQDMPNFSKLALVQSCIVISAIFYLRLQADPTRSTAIATLLCLLIGALLALVGQTYQTGADPWQLFAVWAIFVIPFCVIQGSSTLWLILSLLINLSVSLYYSKFGWLYDILFDDWHLLSLLFAVNAALALLLGMGYYQARPWSKNQIAIQAQVFIAGFIGSWLAVWGIFDFDEMPWAIAAYSLFIGALYYWFRFRKPNLLTLTGICISAIFVGSALLINVFMDVAEDGLFLLISLFIILCSSAAGVWLKNLHTKLSGGEPDE